MHALRILFALVALAAVSMAAEKPNVLIVLTDDQGWGDLSLHGNTNLSTPYIDSLAKDGASFDRFFVCPVCSPTRAEFLTGRYAPRCGVYSTSAGGERLDLDERTIADTFRAAGYATGAFGKWHNGMQYPYHPNGRGFDEYYGFCSGHWGDYFSPPLDHNGEIVKGEGFCIDDFTNKAIAFIEKQHRAEKPFLAYLPYNTPHSPMQVPDRWWDKFKDKEITMRNRDPDKEKLQHLRCALAMCENIDWNVGRLLDVLDKLNIADDTIVAFFHDNGPNGVRWNGDMKGRKGSTDEGGVRSPLLIRWPGKIPAGKKVAPIAGAIDLLPTFAELCSIPVKSEKPLDGRSLRPLLLGAGGDWKERTLFQSWGNRLSARTQQHRLDTKGALFDMVADPGQRKDIAAEKPEIAAKLRADVADWKKNVLGELNRDEKRPFPIGDADYVWTQIPARDAKAHGKLKRSNRFPNCSYFSNWTATDDKLTWPVHVRHTGAYEVTLHYTCPEPDIGSTIELALGKSKLTTKITEPHDVPARGAENDRDKRAESLVKDFKPMVLGTIQLEKGAGELTLRATEIPGKQAMEFRLLMFRRL